MRPLARLRRDQTAAAQQPDDRAGRGHPATALSKVPLDRQRAGVESFGEKTRAQPHDLIGNLEWYRAGRGPRSARARREPRLTLGAVPREQLVQPTAVHAVRARQLGDAASLAQVRLDQIPPNVHPETPSTWCLRCLDTSVRSEEHTSEL